MKKVMVLILLGFLTGCATMTTQDKVFIAGGFVIMGLALSSSDNVIPQSPNCTYTRYMDIRNTKVCP